MGVAIQGNPYFATGAQWHPGLYIPASIPPTPASVSGSQKFGKRNLVNIGATSSGLGALPPSMHVGPRTLNPAGIVQHPGFLAGLMTNAAPTATRVANAGSGAISTLVAQLFNTAQHAALVNGPIPHV